MNQSNKINLLVGGGVNAKSSSGISFFHHESKNHYFLPTKVEIHDTVQSPIQKNIAVAFGRRPPITTSYLIDLEYYQIISEFSALSNHAFYGHGFWTSQNIIGSCEINLENYQSFIVLRDGENPNKVIEVINAEGSAIHMAEYFSDLDQYIVANNGDWYNQFQNDANFSIIKNHQCEKINFPHLPKTFGLQHFIRHHHLIYFAFREPPELFDEKTHESKCTPFYQFNLKTHALVPMIFPEEDLILNRSEGLSLAISKNVLCLTSLKGNSFSLWNTETNQLIKSFPIRQVSGVTNLESIDLNQHGFHLSSFNGMLYELDLMTMDFNILSKSFYASSHHQIFSLN